MKQPLRLIASRQGRFSGSGDCVRVALAALSKRALSSAESREVWTAELLVVLGKAERGVENGLRGKWLPPLGGWAQDLHYHRSGWAGC